MATRTHGTLSRWNDDRGFGFITPASGSAEIFVHVSAFPRDGIRPRIGELVSFELEPGDNGKMRAIRIMRPGGQGGARRTPHSRPGKSSRGLAAVFASLLAACAIGAIGYQWHAGRQAGTASMAFPASTTPASAPAPGFRCDGRQHCSQMNSYEEARFFIQHCPDTKMDGDHDGIPCESQFNQ